MKRGLTLVEMLFALSLLGVLTIAMVSWTRLSLLAPEDVTRRMHWESAAEEVLQRIHEDLLTGDFATSTEHPGVTTEAGKLRIRTRRLAAKGATVLREYALEGDRGELVLQEKELDGDRTPTAIGEPTLLLSDALRLSCRIDEPSAQLEVEIEAKSGAKRARRYQVP